MKKNKSKILTHKIGHLPGSLIYTGNKIGDHGLIQQLIYNEDFVKLNEKLTYDEVIKSTEKEKVNWIHFNSLNHVETIEKIGQYFDIHTLMLEDTLNVEHLPKVEFSENHVFFTLKILSTDPENQVEQEHASFILGDYYLMSFQEQEGELFNTIKDRILKNIGKVRQKHADYLFYLLMDTIVDNYFVVIENIRKSLEEIEDLLINYPSEDYIYKIHYIKKQILFVRKYVFALRESINNLINEEPDQIFESNYKYIRDVKDHVNHIYESIETYREDQKTLMELNSSNLNNNLNQVMKTLTIVASIFIPLTFIAGIYGMNFHFMPELNLKWGYFGVLTVMASVASIMIWYMKRKKWF